MPNKYNLNPDKRFIGMSTHYTIPMGTMGFKHVIYLSKAKINTKYRLPKINLTHLGNFLVYIGQAGILCLGITKKGQYTVYSGHNGFIPAYQIISCVEETPKHYQDKLTIKTMLNTFTLYTYGKLNPKAFTMLNRKSGHGNYKNNWFDQPVGALHQTHNPSNPSFLQIIKNLNIPSLYKKKASWLSILVLFILVIFSYSFHGVIPLPIIVINIVLIGVSLITWTTHLALHTIPAHSALKLSSALVGLAVVISGISGGVIHHQRNQTIMMANAQKSETLGTFTNTANQSNTQLPNQLVISHSNLIGLKNQIPIFNFKINQRKYSKTKNNLIITGSYINNYSYVWLESLKRENLNINPNQFVVSAQSGQAQKININFGNYKSNYISHNDAQDLSTVEKRNDKFIDCKDYLNGSLDKMSLFGNSPYKLDKQPNAKAKAQQMVQNTVKYPHMIHIIKGNQVYLVPVINNQPQYSLKKLDMSKASFKKEVTNTKRAIKNQKEVCKEVGGILNYAKLADEENAIQVRK